MREQSFRFDDRVERDRYKVLEKKIIRKRNRHLVSNLQKKQW